MSIGTAPLRQSATFMSGEGDEWFKRNFNAPINNKIVQTLTSLDVKPSNIVEVGCGYGRYLNEMFQHYRCNCIGFDPSASAIYHGRSSYPHLDLRIGTAGSFYGLSTNILVFGFCLYLVDRFDLFRIVDDADWSVKENGYIIIHDFDQEKPQAIPYEHKSGVYSYKMDYSKLWLANPAYEFISKTETAEGESITIIQKKGWNRWR